MPGRSLFSGSPIPRALATPSLAALLIGAGLLFVGCPKRVEMDPRTLPNVTTDDPEAESLLRDARRAADAGDLPTAKSTYVEFLATHPDDPMRPIARLELGRIELAEGSLTLARGRFESVAEHADEAVAERGRFYLGITLQLAGEHAEALEMLRPFIGRTVDPEETAMLLDSIATAAAATGDQIGSVEALDALARSDVSERRKDEASARLAFQIGDQLTAEEVQRLVGLLPHDGPGWPVATRRAVRESFASGDMERVLALIEMLREEEITLGEELSAIAIRAERTGQADPRVIGAILPLSGRGREVGQLALRGITLAAGIPATGPADENSPQIVFRDSGGDEERAIAAVDDLVSLHRVIAIIGPVSASAVSGAAERAQELGVPLIALAPVDLPAEATMGFHLLPTPAEEVAALVSSARGAIRFALLAPEGGYGDAMDAALRQAASAVGASVVASGRYPASATEFQEPITAVREAAPDAILLADSARRVSLIAPALMAAGLYSVTGPSQEVPETALPVRLLATSAAYSADIVRTTRRYLQGALFSVPFDAATSTGTARDFANLFQTRFGSAPDLFAVTGRDAFQLVRDLVEAGATTRMAVARGLLGAPTTETVGPSLGFSASRGPRRGARVLALVGDSFEPLVAPAASESAPAVTQ